MFKNTKQKEALLSTLEERFERNMAWHKGIRWPDVLKRLLANEEKLWSLGEMERTGGEPDIIGIEGDGSYTYADCSPESPVGRRSLCYDHEALKARKENRPKNSALNMAKKMGVEILSEKDYRCLQTLGRFDTKTSSWVETPSAIRKLGGALFADRRYDSVFIYHNGADSYYAARGFRAKLKI